MTSLFAAETSHQSEQTTARIPPAKYALIMLNDDYTPMDFVIDVLKRFFHCNLDRASMIMLKIHHQGEGHCGMYTRDIGETKITHIHAYARKHGHPLRCILRKTQG